MANSCRKLIFNIYMGFYCSAILPKICICSQFSMSSIDLLNTDPGAFPVATSGEPFPWNKLRLPSMVVPLHYDLLVHPNLTSLDFVASEKIEVLVRDATQFIILHSKDLEIMNVILQSEEDLRYRKPGKRLNILHYPAHEQIALTYRTHGGKTRIIAVTDFEPTGARMAFPCFDEPLFKAKFSIKIRRESGHVALSNMPKVKTIELEGGILEDHFETSVKMSTYLVAYVVCDFISVSGTTSSGVKVSIYASPDKWSQTHYALEASLKLLNFYENYFDINYPLPKLDLIAIPDFESGAMENWGLITYKETSLLFDTKTSSASDKLWVTKVIAHELAHQWFGNLVTMEWWNDIWLNEGFATYMELISLNATYPELQFDDGFCHTCFAVIKKDSLNSSHPISNQAETPTQIQEMFDAVSYNKGACILNMLKDFLNEEKFRKGVIYYLKKFSYGNAKNDDLWRSLSNSCLDDFTSGEFCYSNSKMTSNILAFLGEHVDVKEMMRTWTLQKGLPLLVIEREGHSLKLRQERFLSGVFKEDPEWTALQEGFLWHIPLTYSTSSSNVVHRHVLKSRTGNKLMSQTGWVKFNVDSNGYYIVHYEGHGWDQLITQLSQNHTLLRPKDRVGLIHDAFQLVSIPSDVLEIVYSIGAQTTVGWNYLLEQYGLSVSGAEKNKILYALSTSKHQEKLIKLIELGMEGEVIKTQELGLLFHAITRSPQGQQLAWNFLRENWTHLLKKFDLGSHAMRIIISGTTSHFSSKDELQEVKLFFESLEAQGLHLDIFQIILETISKNIKWLEKNLPTLKTWLLVSS
uniref:Aminopeptidase n=1 Tax=Canis lupus familiaris TaxID=9615 RepID=A0A8C0Z0K2_CANLF